MSDPVLLPRPRELRYPGGGAALDRDHYTVGDALPLPAGPPATRVTLPDDTRENLLGPTLTFAAPGVYRLQRGEELRKVAVNLSPAESATAPLEGNSLAQYGIPVERVLSHAAMRAEQRRLRSWEIESRQKMWRWLLLAVLIALALETGLAGRLAHDAARRGKPSRAVEA